MNGDDLRSLDMQQRLKLLAAQVKMAQEIIGIQGCDYIPARFYLNTMNEKGPLMELGDFTIFARSDGVKRNH